MAHKLKYYKEIESHGHLWRVEILQDTEDTLTPMEIGPVLQGLRLVVQGDQADVDTPIVKTSLEMTFVDAPDLEEERKCGYWEEFYTSSATEYQVKLYKDGQIEWTGYVTPDSFSEDLRYRGSVSIIARDNLGALQDYMFNAHADESGLISLSKLVSEGLSNVHYAMELTLPSDGAIPYTEEASGHSLNDILFNHISFKDKTWQEALEQALYSIGFVLRYVGNNKLILVSIRDIPLLSNHYFFDVPVLSASWCAYATRELSPAVKSIKEEVNFEIEEKSIYIDSDIDSYEEESILKSYDYDGYLQNPLYNTLYETPVNGYNVIGYGMVGSEAGSSRLLNPFAYKIDFEHSSQEWGSFQSNNVLYILCNTFEEELSSNLVKTNPFKCSIRLQQAGKFNIQYKFAHPIALYNNRTAIGNYADMAGYSEAYAQNYAFRAKWEGDDGQLLYLKTTKVSGQYGSSWSTSEQSDLVYLWPVDAYYGYECEPFPELTTSSAGKLTIEFYGGAIVGTDRRFPGSEGVYVRLTDIVVENTQNNQEQYLLEQLRVNTIYNKGNNIILNRTPEYANNPSIILTPSIINNGIYVLTHDNTYRGSEFWQFKPNDTKQQLSTLIHQQLLAYYSKPNNVLTGELATPNPLFNALYEWQGKKHLLTSGALNVITGRMENVVLREFMRYDHMWETWVENEDRLYDYPSRIVPLICHTSKELTESDIYNLPLWLSVRNIGNINKGRQLISLDMIENASGKERQAIFRIDTAYVRVTQRAAGDYGIDYGKDYS
jgi:hypothetical protein